MADILKLIDRFSVPIEEIRAAAAARIEAGPSTESEFVSTPGEVAHFLE
jgi:hypothetical protein